MELRKHQREFKEIIDNIINGSNIKNIIVKATPGSGKSSLPILAGELITAGLADAIAWICPRNALKEQGERNFIDPYFKEAFNHSLIIRSSINDHNPCRNLNGWISTYQAIGVDDRETVLSDFRRKRYILVLDEYHHAGDEGAWTKALMPLYDASKYCVLMTGTLARGDKKRIAFTPYQQVGDVFTPMLDKSSNTAVINYTRKDALADKAILPLEFIFLDGAAKWETRSGRIIDSKVSNQTNATHALYTALNTEYATELLLAAVNSWRGWRNAKPSARLLVVAANIKAAKGFTETLKRMGLNTRIATSDDSVDAQDAIKAYKSGKLEVLVSVGMCYEGLDVPAISHIACLTNIRSLPWIEQMAARAVRIDSQAGPYESQKAFIFAPKDPMFVELKAQIDAEQNAAAKSSGVRVVRDGSNGELFPGLTAPGGIKPLSSKILGVDIPQVPLIPIETQSEKESSLRELIDRHIKLYSGQNRFSPKRINGEVFTAMRKRREDMTLAELEKCLELVRRKYPLTFFRGTGRRVPTKAQPFPCTWR